MCNSQLVLSESEARHKQPCLKWVWAKAMEYQIRTTEPSHQFEKGHSLSFQKPPDTNEKIRINCAQPPRWQLSVAASGTPAIMSSRRI